MLDPTKIESIMRGSGRESDELRQTIVRDTGMFTVVLFAVFDSKEGDRLELAGTGTLLAVGSSHYILTAAHVWEEVLKSAIKVGITLRENVDHQFLMDVRTIVPFGPPKPRIWNEWGPDIVFLRVPPEHVSTINAFRVFDNLTTEANGVLNMDHLETRMMLGAPKASGTFTQTHADVQINGFFMPDPVCHTRGDFDYLDFEVNTSFPGIPESFGGVSGGGLRKVQIYGSPSADTIESVAILEGVAFYQSAVVNGRRIIRCHGPKTIRAAMPSG
jgi:hypothetical protein